MKTASTLPLLLEVGCEEIPARFLTDAQKNLAAAIEAALREAHLLAVMTASEPAVQAYSTPRRLVVHVPQVLERQPEKVEEVTGPPVKVAFDAAGKPTRAAESFAEKNGVSVQDLVRVTTPKGEYLALRKTTRGRPADELLPEILPQAILGLSFPKSMYWVGKSGPRFVRPIRWILALLGEGKGARVIPFEIAGVKSGSCTFGHRAHAQGALRVANFRDYVKRLRQGHAEIDSSSRREAITRKSKVLLENRKLRAVPDEALLEWMVNSCEWPHPLMGSFDPRFLRLPREILVTVMRDHQKYFAVEDRKGNLQPHFIAVLNMRADAKGLIRQGHERVLTARFSDAEFFWAADQRLSLADRRGLLTKVTFQAELGTYAEKVRRMKVITSRLCAVLEEKGLLKHPETSQVVLRAVELSKCDLTTQMVQEFPELQGVVGGLYAAAQEESSQVSEAVYDHYLPQGAEDACPRSVVGAVVALADKLDNVVGGFAVGHEPSGSSDPFALRRQGNGIIKVLLELKLPIALKDAIQEAINALDLQWRTPRDEVFSRVLDFFAERIRYYFETVRKLRYDTVRAVLAAGWDPPLDALARAEALEGLRGSENLEAVCAAAKRIKNILTKSASSEDLGGGAPEPSMFGAGPERELFEAWKLASEKESKSRRDGQYRAAFEAIAEMRPAVDRFFDKVLVMTEDRKVRQNRLSLLGLLDDLFSAIAHFAEIVPSAEANVDASTLQPAGQARRRKG